MDGRRGFGRIVRAVAVAGLAHVLLFACVAAAAQARKPISKTGLVEALRIGGLSRAELVRQVEQRGVDFELTEQVAAELRRAGAGPALLRAVGANRRAAAGDPARTTTAASKTAGTPSQPPPPPPAPRVALGLFVQDLSPALAATMGVNVRGVFVSTVEAAGLAGRAGLERRDVITAFNDEPVTDTESLRRQLSRLRAGELFSLTVLREGSVQKLTVGGADKAIVPEKKPSTHSPDSAMPATNAGPAGGIGLSLEPLTPELTARFQLSKVKGMVVTYVESSGPAWAAGVRVGDVVEKYNGKDVRNASEVERAQAKTEGGRVRLRIKRGGESFNVDMLQRAPAR